MASVDARALLGETGLLEAWRGVDECNSDSGGALVPPSFIERRPRGESLKFGSLLDSAGEEVTPRVGVMLISRALLLFFPYYANSNVDDQQGVRMEEGRKKSAA